MAATLSPALRRLGGAATALIALTYLVLMLIAGALPESRQLVRSEAAGVMELAPEQIVRATVSADGTRSVFARQAQAWVGERGAGQPLSDPVAAELDQAVKFMHTAKPVRVLEPEEIADADAAAFGLDPPQLAVALEDEGGLVLDAAFGRYGPDGRVQYMRVAGRPQLYLMSRFVGEAWAAIAAVAPP